MNACVHSFCNSFFHVSSFHSIPVFHSFSHSFIQSVSQSFIPFTPFFHSIIHSFHSIPFIHLFHLIPLMHSCIHSFNHSCMPSFTKSFFFLSSSHFIPFIISCHSCLFIAFIVSFFLSFHGFSYLSICSSIYLLGYVHAPEAADACKKQGLLRTQKAVARRPRTRPTRLARLHCRRSSMGSAKLAPSRLELEYLALHLTGRAPQAFAST